MRHFRTVLAGLLVALAMGCGNGPADLGAERPTPREEAEEACFRWLGDEAQVQAAFVLAELGQDLGDNKTDALLALSEGCGPMCGYGGPCNPPCIACTTLLLEAVYGE